MTSNDGSGIVERKYPHLTGCLWSMAKWAVGMTAFFITTDLLRVAFGAENYVAGALACVFATGGYLAGQLDAKHSAARAALRLMEKKL